MTSPSVLLLPGWLDSDASHWQSRWERRHGYRRVEQDDWVWPRRGDWMARLEEMLLPLDAPVTLVAHSLGCLLVAAWAAHSRRTAHVHAALLVAPPDTERDDAPVQLHGWRPIVRTGLPFAATVVASTDDPYCRFDRAAELAHGWGASLFVAGAWGHLNGDSGLGDWPQGQDLLASLLHARRTPAGPPPQA